MPNSRNTRRSLALSALRSALRRARGMGRRSPLAAPRPTNRRLQLEPLEERSLMALVSYWNADNTAVDSVSGNNGTLQNGAAYVAGQVNQAFSFDGVDDRI